MLLRRFRLRNFSLLIFIIIVSLSFYKFYHNGNALNVDWWLKRNEIRRPFFNKKHNFDCGLAFSKKFKGNNSFEWTRPVDSEYKTWGRIKDCNVIRQRNFYPNESASDQEADFPLAYVILVDGHLEQLEMLFSAIYAPQNFYCFHVDFKAHFMVHHFMKKLTSCFDQSHVFVADQSVPLVATSVSVLYAQRACLLKLDAASKHGAWRYALTIDGHDFPLRTNREIVEILKLHQGANDVELVQPLHYRYEKQHRTVTDQFGQPIDMEETTKIHAPPWISNLKIYKGNLASALSKEFVEFLLYSDVGVSLLSWLSKAYMPSELFLSTLNHNEFLNASGGYPGRCVEGKRRKLWISRFTVWNTYDHLKCLGQWDGATCAFGVGDLWTLDQRPELFAHRFDLKSSVALDCLHERIFNRTYAQQDPLKKFHSFLDYYDNLSTVQYQRWKTRPSEENMIKFKNVFSCVGCDNCEH